MTEQQNGQIEQNEEMDIKKEVISWIRFFVIMLAAMFVLRSYVIMSVFIPSESMENQLQKGDRLIGSRLSYKFSDPERLDIVIFKYPVNEEKYYIKRIIGLPGETVTIEKGKIYIDGSDEPLDEPYLKEEWTNCNDGYVFHVPEGCYLMLGDNRNCSEDARCWGNIAVEKGKADTLEEGEKFCYVAREKIVAKAIWKYWKVPKILE